MPPITIIRICCPCHHPKLTTMESILECRDTKATIVDGRVLVLPVAHHGSLLHHHDIARHIPQMVQNHFCAQCCLAICQGLCGNVCRKVTTKKEFTSYKTMPQLMYAIIVIVLISCIAFHVSLRPPVYSRWSMLIVLTVSTFLLHLCLLFPTIVQNIVAFALLPIFYSF